MKKTLIITTLCSLAATVTNAFAAEVEAKLDRIHG